MTVLDEIAASISELVGEPVLKVAVDGVDGVGKTTFADLLGHSLVARGRTVIRSSVDGFHNPRAMRYRLGRGSPQGFYRDSYDYGALRENLLDPLSSGGSRRYRTAVFDHFSDCVVCMPWQSAPENAVLVFDGLFLHRQELRAYWDYSIFLDAPFELTVPRGAMRGEGYGNPDPGARSNHRYVQGNKIYFSRAQPKDRATVVVDYADLAKPSIVKWNR